MLRDQIIKKWIATNLGKNIKHEPASSDASFRRYFRLKDDEASYILMDAPPDREPIKSYITVTKTLLANNIRAPKIFITDEDNGFLLLEDFGNETLYKTLNETNYDDYYNRAIEVIINLQKINKNNNLNNYTEKILTEEISLFNTWYLIQNKKILLSGDELESINLVFKKILLSNQEQPFYFVHRDFHSRNIMRLKDNNIGVIDFQDALIGPITYDLVSLLKDAYVELEEEFIIDKSVRFWERACKEGLLQKNDFSDFFLKFEMMGVQRHLKVLGIFSRLSLRDGKHNYLSDIPLVERYLLKVSERYSLLSPLKKILLRAMNEK